MREAVSEGSVPHCETPQCNGLVKPDIVFFGEQLPTEFYRNRILLREADLCIVMGTSLSVHPFASLPDLCAQGVPRVLINLERVGGLGSRADDVLLLGDCDSEVRKLAAALGWARELESTWRNTQPSIGDAFEPEEQNRKSNEGDVSDQVSKLSREIDLSLKISRQHAIALREGLKQQDLSILEEADPDGVEGKIA